MNDRPEDSAERNLTDADRELHAMLDDGYTFRETATRLGITLEELEQSRSRTGSWASWPGRRQQGGGHGGSGW